MADGRLTCALEPGDDELQALLLSCAGVAPMIELPSLKPTKRLEVLWKTAAKHFRDLALDECDIVMRIADRRGAVPTHVFKAGTHAQMTLQQAYDLLPPAPSAEAMRQSGLPAEYWARRLSGVIHLYFDFTEASRHKLRAAAAAKDRDAPGGSERPNLAAGGAPACSADGTPIPPASSTTLSKAGASSGNGSGGASKWRGAKAAGPGSLWRQKEVDRRKSERILSSDAVTRPTPLSAPASAPSREGRAEAPAEGGAVMNGIRRGTVLGASRPEPAQNVPSTACPIPDPERGLAPAAPDASGGETPFTSDSSSHRQSMLMQASDVASTDVYAAADMPGGSSSWSIFPSCRSNGGHSNSGDVSLPLDQPRGVSQSAVSESHGERRAATQAGPGITSPRAVAQCEAEPRRSFARLGSRLSGAGGLGGGSLTLAPDGSAQPLLEIVSAQETSGRDALGEVRARGVGSSSSCDGASRGCAALSSASALSSGGGRAASQQRSGHPPPLFTRGVLLGTTTSMSGPLPGAELSVGAVERLLFDERSQSLAHSEGHAGKGGDPASTTSCLDAPKSTRDESSLRFQLRLGKALTSVTASSCKAAASYKQEGSFCQPDAALESDGQPKPVAPVNHTCILPAEAEKAVSAVDTPAQIRAPLLGESTKDDDASAAEPRSAMPAQGESDGLHGQECSAEDAGADDAPQRVHGSLAGSDLLKPESEAAPPIPSLGQEEELEADATAQDAAESDAEAADDLAAALRSESDSDEDDWEAEWNSAEQEVREEDQARAVAVESSSGEARPARRLRSKSREASPFKSPRKSPRGDRAAQEMQAARTPRNRLERTPPGSERASKRIDAPPTHAASPPSAMVSPPRAQHSTQNGSALPSDDSDDDRPVAELLSEWTRGVQALHTTASHPDHAGEKRPLTGGVAVSHPKRGRSAGDFVSDGSVPLPPLSPITAPLDAELDAQLQSQGRELFLSGIASTGASKPDSAAPYGCEASRE